MKGEKINAANACSRSVAKALIAVLGGDDPSLFPAVAQH